ncbi:YLP motif-containing protein 1-like isoform X2 [Limulus polyphemus]|uniref:YLP motif-containing protein 1-like isoform X2 n=1 Tax=Limulus polyphemus TaxID=6850 RepID=A0ABM1SIX8_LIMPO|nr:YLP motif-containing protein 1-like isoform X2 [Limulus polyphemus]
MFQNWQHWGPNQLPMGGGGVGGFVQGPMASSGPIQGGPGFPGQFGLQPNMMQQQWNWQAPGPAEQWGGMGMNMGAGAVQTMAMQNQNLGGPVTVMSTLADQTVGPEPLPPGIEQREVPLDETKMNGPNPLDDMERERLQRLRAEAEAWQAQPMMQTTSSGWPNQVSGTWQHGMVPWQQQGMWPQGGMWPQRNFSQQLGTWPTQPNQGLWSAEAMQEATQIHVNEELKLMELDPEEQEFEREFLEWQREFENWKEQNKNHPDKEAFARYEEQWQEWKKQLLERRDQMRQMKAQKLEINKAEKNKQKSEIEQSTTVKENNQGAKTEQEKNEKISTEVNLTEKKPQSADHKTMLQKQIQEKIAQLKKEEEEWKNRKMLGPLAPPLSKSPGRSESEKSNVASESFKDKKGSSREKRDDTEKKENHESGSLQISSQSDISSEKDNEKLKESSSQNEKNSKASDENVKNAVEELKAKGQENHLKSLANLRTASSPEKEITQKKHDEDKSGRKVLEEKDSFGRSVEMRERMKSRGRNLRRGGEDDDDERDPEKQLSPRRNEKRRSRSRERRRSRSRSRERDRYRDYHRYSRDHSRDRHRPRSRERSRSRERDRYREREHSRDRPRHHSKESDRFRDKLRDRSKEKDRVLEGKREENGDRYKEDQDMRLLPFGVDERFEKGYPSSDSEFYIKRSEYLERCKYEEFNRFPWFREENRFYSREGIDMSSRLPPPSLPTGMFFSTKTIEYGHQRAATVVGEDFAEKFGSIRASSIGQSSVFGKVESFDYGHQHTPTPVKSEPTSSSEHILGMRMQQKDWSPLKNLNANREFSRLPQVSAEQNIPGLDIKNISHQSLTPVFRDDNRGHSNIKTWNSSTKVQEEEKPTVLELEKSVQSSKRVKENFTFPAYGPESVKFDENLISKTTPPVEKKTETVRIEDLLSPPGRLQRPKHIVIILRGPPGSGKTYVAKLIKDKEIENGGSAPRILCLDDYFMVETEKLVKDPDTGKRIRKKEFEYDYEPEMEEAYSLSLLKSFKKTVDDRFFPVIIVDAVNSRVKQFENYWTYAKQKGFQVYVAEMECMDPSICHKRNIHKRSQEDIQKMVSHWESTPTNYILVDIRSLLQDAAITEVEMEDFVPEEENTKNENKQRSDDDDDEEEDLPVHVPSRWEKMESTEEKLDRLDGLRVGKKKHSSLEEYLQLPDDYEQRESRPGQKRVRWADIEERKTQERMRAIGFVVGQTDWQKMTDPSHAERALTRTKYI